MHCRKLGQAYIDSTAKFAYSIVVRQTRSDAGVLPLSLRMLIILDLYLLFSLDEAYKSMESDERGHSIVVQVRLKNESSDRRSEDVVMAESMKTSEATSGLTKELHCSRN